jgi:hypothetical protein
MSIGFRIPVPSQVVRHRLRAAPVRGIVGITGDVPANGSFAASNEAGRRPAAIHTLIETAKLKDIHLEDTPMCSPAPQSSCQANPRSPALELEITSTHRSSCLIEPTGSPALRRDAVTCLAVFGPASLPGNSSLAADSAVRQGRTMKRPKFRAADRLIVRQGEEGNSDHNWRRK